MGKLNEELRAAACSGDAERVIELLRHGASASSGNRMEQNALHLAAMNGHAKCCGILARACDPNAGCFYRKTALIYAAEHGSAECVRVLLPASDALKQAREGHTALTVAIREGNVECVEELLAWSDCAGPLLHGGKSAQIYAKSLEQRGIEHYQCSRLVSAYVLARAEKDELIVVMDQTGAMEKGPGKRL